MSDQNDGAFLGGLLVGSALGAIAALLYAPRSGKDTRKILKQSMDNLPELADELSETFQKQADQLSDNARRNWEGTLQRLQEAIAAGMEASQAESERLETSPEEEIFVSPDIDSPPN
ncbi:YtxH domain-containing protein [[Limnothrix rosea] IAM M-220]|uniref:YtxH domain-containing protein n=1 Tax=[Limnothrix rosea] IAM M-220 TaxID=454133 RepID=UPI0009670D8F|nr:YtxH domain-containing protein [[Limnothrix rosea] IAM M-220]OKH18950.1 gas vesicle protein [[Limnothrix rosea] IAM M-220]